MQQFLFVFFSEKLRLGRRTAASCRDEALYTNRSGVFLLLNASETFFPARPNEEEFDDITKEQFSLLFFCPSVQTCSPESFCRLHHLPSPSHCASGDNLWLPGLSSHLGATLRNDRGSRGGLTVQAEAADHVLQSRAFRLPLLQRQRKTERGKKHVTHVCQWVLRSAQRCTQQLPLLLIIHCS